MEYVVPVYERTWNRLCCGSVIIFALHNCDSRQLWWWCHVIYFSAVKNGHIFRLCRWEDPPSEVRPARGVLRGEVSIASYLGYSVCGSSEATRWGASFCCPLMLGEENYPKAENLSKTQNLTEIATPLYYKDMSINIPDIFRLRR